MSRSPRPGLLVLIVAALVAMLAWAWRDPEPDPRRAAGPAANADAGSASVDASRAGHELPKRELAAEADGGADRGNGPVLRIRLRGLDRSAPWTVPLRLDLEGRAAGADDWIDHEAREPVAADGTARFELPAAILTATHHRGRLEAEDPNYRPLQFRWRKALDYERELVLDVQAVAVLVGRVVDPRGKPVSAAQVTAFALDEGDPVEPQIGTTTTSLEGRYHLEAAPGVPLLLVVTPMKPALISGHRLTGRHGAIAALGIVRPDLLPASREVRGVLGAQTTVPDVVLPDAAIVSGVVRWTNGDPIERAEVTTQTRRPIGLEISANAHVRRARDGSLELTASTWTGEGGTFELPATPGQRVHIGVTELPGVLFHADVRTTSDPAPARAVIEVPAPVRLRPTLRGQPVPQAVVEVAGGSQRCDDNGIVRLVTTRTLTARARHGRFVSASTTVLPTQGGTTVELPLSDALTRVAIGFDGEFPVRNASFHWRRQDGEERTERLQRSDGSGPFVLHLAPGTYLLRVGPAPGERNGIYLLPIERTVDIGTADVTLDLPARFGGQFAIHATDSSGRYVGGTCIVRNSAGDVVGGTFRVSSWSRSTRAAGPGEILADGPNTFDTILAPGDYELELGFEHLGAERRIVTIKPREVMDVRIRLP